MPTSVTSVGLYAFYYSSALSGAFELIDATVPTNAFTGCKNLTALNYTTNSDGTLTLSRCYVSLDSVKIPSTVAGKRVTAIGREAFSFFNTLKNVSIPEGITSIGASAFYYCSALESVTAGRTCLMIAHRLSTVRNADMILVVKNGQIVEQGTHPDLLKLRGYYYELYTRQYEDEATAKILA